MKTYFRKAVAAGLFGLTALSLPACNEFVAVDNPNSLETDAIDPERDATLLSQSVYTRFVSTIEYAYVLGAWFTNHARVGDTFPTRNAVGQRNIPNAGNETDGVWNSLHTNLQFARSTIRSTEAAGNTVDLARAWFVSGFSILQQAEYFCEGTIAESTLVPRGKMSTAALLDSAIIDLTKVQTVVAGLAAPNAEATALSNAAQVGIARALLQLGRMPQASAAAAAVSPTFVYNFLHIDNSTQRALGNTMWSFSESRISLVVGPEFRAMADANDPRIRYTNMNRLSQDGELQFFRQGKHPGWAAPMRFASGLEAQYIKEEADQNPVTMLAFIQARRAAGNQAAMAATADMTVLMTELMLQKSKDFWLEGRNMADFRRNPTIFPFVLPTGPNYYKPQLGPVGTDLCWPVPRSELERNTKWNTGT